VNEVSMAALASSIDEARRAEIGDQLSYLRGHGALILRPRAIGKERPFMDTGDPSSFENVQRINVPCTCPTSQPYKRAGLAVAVRPRLWERMHAVEVALPGEI
jgi:hypothetical protein